MRWHGASQRKGTLSRLEPHGQDVKAVTLYTHNFVLLDGVRSDESKQFFYTAVAETPEEAEALAFAIYQQARSCQHNMQPKGPVLCECTFCGIQRRAPQVAKVGAASPKAKPQRRWFPLSLFGN